MRALILLLVAIPLAAQTPAYPGAVATNNNLMTAANRISTTLQTTMPANTAIMQVASATGIVPNMLLSIGTEIVVTCSVVGNTIQIGKSSCPNIDGRGFDGTVTQVHPLGQTVNAYIDAWHHNSLAAEIKAIETTLGPNLSNVPGVIGSGIVSLGGLTTAIQTFANDTNVTMTNIGAVHTLGWTGTLAPVRGGTGLDTHASTGIPSITAGSWSILTPTGTGVPVLQTAPMIASPIITGHATIEGVTPTGATGNGNLVFSSGPTFTGTVQGGGSTWSGLVIANSLRVSNITGGTQCLHADTAGNITGTGSDCGSGGGAGTVTVVGAGNLTSTAIITGGGLQTLQTAAPTATMDSSGNITTPGSLSAGLGSGVAGFLQVKQGTLPSLVATAIQIVAPSSVTNYQFVLPSASATGFMLGTDASNTNTISMVGFSGTGNVARVGSPTFTSSLTLGGVTGSTQCLHVDSAGLISGTGSDCGAGGGGSGTVTVVASGNLTSTALVTGGGLQTLQTPSATATMDTSGNVSTPGSFTGGAGGSVAGFIQMGQGSAPSLGTTAVTISAPASVTSYRYVLPGAAATGLLYGANSSNVVTLSAATGANVVSAFTGTPTGSKFLRDDGTLAIPAGGGTIASTTSTLKGDGGGNAVAVTGTGTNCVQVNGSSTSCGGGGSPTYPSAMPYFPLPPAPFSANVGFTPTPGDVWCFDFFPPGDLSASHMVVHGTSGGGANYIGYRLFDNSGTSIWNGRLAMTTSAAWYDVAASGVTSGFPISLSGNTKYSMCASFESAVTGSPSQDGLTSPALGGYATAMDQGVAGANFTWYKCSNSNTGSGSSFALPTTCGTKSSSYEFFGLPTFGLF